MMRFVILLAITVSVSCTTSRELLDAATIQDDTYLTDPIAAIENNTLDDEMTENEVEDVLLELEDLTHNPVMVNTATLDDLMRIPAMRPAYARAILRQRDTLGRFSQGTQLSVIPGIPVGVMLRITPYLTLGSASDIIRHTLLEPEYWKAGLTMESLTRVRSTVELADGYRSDLSSKDRMYLGPPTERYQRFVLRSRHFTAGTQLRGMPGARGMNHKHMIQVSHVGLIGLPIVERAVLGRYKVSYGMGLSMSGGRSQRRGFEVTLPRTADNVVSTYSGSSYNTGYLGAAIHRGSNIRTSIWVSTRAYTGATADSAGVRWSTSEPMFRTANEIAQRDNFSVKLIGFRTSIHKSKHHVGLAAWSAASNVSIVPNATPSDVLRLMGTRFGMLSADFEVNLKDGTIQAEIARDVHGGIAAVVAGDMSVVGGLDLTTIVRYYDTHFQSPYGASFSAWSGRPANEKGWFFSLNYRPSRHVSIVVYNDLFSSLAPRQSDHFPTGGSEVGIRLIHRFGSSEIQSTIRQSVKDAEIDAADTFERLYRRQFATSRTNARVDLKTSLLPRATWVTRAEWVRATQEIEAVEHGYLIHQDLSWWISSKIRLQARVTIYSSDSHNARLFAWEPDVGLMSALPSYQGMGSRQFVLVTYKPRRQVEARIKVARTHLPYEYTIGSGNDLVRGNKKTQINTSILLRV